MRQINVIIAESNRQEHLASCLHYLSAANVGREYSVDVYVVRDGINSSELTYESIKVHTVLSSLYCSREFNKSRLLNYGLLCMKRPFDWLSIVDVDMIYRYDFFSMIDNCMHSRSYVICNGRHLDSNDVYEGNSQISMSFETYQLFQNIYGENLYCEDFIGWGGEDSDVSFKAADLRREGLINITKLADMWFHIPHDKKTNNREKNRNLFEVRRGYNKQLLKTWLESRVPFR